MQAVSSLMSAAPGPPAAGNGEPSGRRSGPAAAAIDTRRSETRSMHCSGQTSTQPPHWMHSLPFIRDESNTVLTQQCRHRLPSARASASPNTRSTSAACVRRSTGSAESGTLGRVS